MGKLWLIRHGQASFGKTDYDSLSLTGCRQAEITGSYFADAGIDFEAVYSGDMKRQTDTAKLAMATAGEQNRALNIQILTQFNEYDFMKIIHCLLPAMINENPILAGQAKDIFKDDRIFVELFSKLFLRWISGNHDAAGVESFKHYKTRIINGIETIINTNSPGNNIAVFTSGGVIGTLLLMVLGLSNETSMETGWQVCNASITTFEVRDSHLTLSCFNSCVHLELQNDRDLITFR